MMKKDWEVFEIFLKRIVFSKVRRTIRHAICHAIRHAFCPIRQYKLAGRLVPRGGRSDGLGTVRARRGTACARLATVRARLGTVRARLGTARARHTLQGL